MDFPSIGKLLLLVGLVLAGLGLLLMIGGKGPLAWIGRLPGDFHFRGEKFSFYFPLATSLIISVLATLVIWFINRR